MIEKRTVIDQIEITRGGHIQIRFGLLLVEDGVEVGCQWHRTSVEPGGDVDAMIAAVNADITARPTLRANELDGGDPKVPILKQIAGLVHTPDVVTKYRADVTARADAAQVASNGQTKADAKKPR